MRHWRLRDKRFGSLSSLRNLRTMQYSFGSRCDLGFEIKNRNVLCYVMLCGCWRINGLLNLLLSNDGAFTVTGVRGSGSAKTWLSSRQYALQRVCCEANQSPWAIACSYQSLFTTSDFVMRCRFAILFSLRKRKITNLQFWPFFIN
jgi:hypothetical protein